MISLVETGLMNAVLATALALPVLVMGRVCHRPALIHAFWVLVLLKLVSPPLFQIPVDWQMPAQAGDARLETGVDSIPANQPASATHSWISGQLPSLEAVGRRLNYGLRVVRRFVVPGLCVWLLGSAGWFGWQSWRIIRFTQVFLKYSRRGPPSLQKRALVLARRMGLSRCPEVWLLPAVVSPMLWSVGGQCRILFPRELLGRLDHPAVATLLTHELAHYRRGDHRVRLLEFLACGLFWWHPLVWLARRELEISEEKCCDAWVVDQFPAAQRQYADALLATVDFLAREHPPLPAVACGLGEVPLLRQRLKLIMCGTAPKSLSRLGRLAVLATALLIPVSPSFRVRALEPPGQAQVAPVSKSNAKSNAGSDAGRQPPAASVVSQSDVIEGEVSVRPPRTGTWQIVLLAELRDLHAILKTVRLQAGLDGGHRLAFVRLTANGRFLLGAEWNGSVFTWTVGSRVLIS